LIKDTPVLLAPRGEFSSGAISIKSLKKKVFMATARIMKLYDNIVWHASTKVEKQDIVDNYSTFCSLSDQPNICVAQNFSFSPKATPKITDKQTNELNAVFVSRINTKKNLSFALKVLGQCKGKITYNIYGPIDPTNEWVDCLKLIESMPDNIKITYHGAVTPEQVPVIFSKSDIFFFPTRGENFGHVIVESLSVGCPVLLSDTTPWLDLDEKAAGWVIPLHEPNLFKEKLESLTRMDSKDFNKFKLGAMEYAKNILNDEATLDDNIQMFKKTCHSKSI
jgi:glycosyltransferase involved in cell wall biosynthesis